MLLDVSRLGVIIHSWCDKYQQTIAINQGIVILTGTETFAEEPEF